MSRPNVLMVLMDGCRAESLGCYGNRRDASPFIDRLAADGVVAERVYATSHCTMPSVISMMTGAYPAQHGAAGTWSYYDGRFPFLPERLQGAGYQTFYASNAVTAMSPEWGFIRGYDRAYRAGREVNWFRDSAERRRGVRRERPLERLKRDMFAMARRYFPDQAEQVRRDAQVEWYRANDRGSAKAVECVGRMLAERDQDRPFFMYVNLPDTHSPYLAPRPYNDLWGPIALTPRLLSINLTPGEFYDHEEPLTADEKVVLRQMYDTCVSYIDHCVAEIYKQLDAAGVRDNTVVMLLGDHGGEAGEHRDFVGGASFAYEPEIRVPLIVSGAGKARISGLHSVIDVYPTVLELCGVALDKDRALPCRSVLSDSDGHDAVLADVPSWPDWLRNMVEERSMLLRYGHAFRALIKRDGTKTIWVADGCHERYDLVSDPGETRNLFDARTDRHLIAEIEAAYVQLIGDAGRRLEMFDYADVGPRLAKLPPIDVVNPAFKADSAVGV